MGKMKSIHSCLLFFILLTRLPQCFQSSLSLPDFIDYDDKEVPDKQCDGTPCPAGCCPFGSSQTPCFECCFPGDCDYLMGDYCCPPPCELYPDDPECIPWCDEAWYHPWC